MDFLPHTRSDEVLVLDRAGDADDEQDGDPLHPDDLCSHRVSLLSETGCPSCGEYLLSSVRHPRHRRDAYHICRLHARVGAWTSH